MRCFIGIFLSVSSVRTTENLPHAFAFPIFLLKSKSTIKPPFRKRTDISRRLDTINKTFIVDCARFEPQKSTSRKKMCFHSLCTLILSLWGRLQIFTIHIYFVYIYIVFIFLLNVDFRRSRPSFTQDSSLWPPPGIMMMIIIGGFIIKV